MSFVRSVLREPLAQFLVAGAALFLLFRLTSDPAREAAVVVTRAQIENLAAGFARTWQRAPSEADLKGLVDDLVREELARREAISLGLDEGDTIIGRRLRQKYEFLVEDALDAAPPSDDELRAHLESHPEAFREEPRVAFRHVVLKGDIRGAALAGDARTLLEALRRAGPDAELAGMGDPFTLPNDFALTGASGLSGLFGDAFAAWLLEAEPGRWAGPVESPYGWHLVLVREREEGRLPDLASVRDAVERAVLAARRKERLEAAYARLLEKYPVEIEGDARPGAGR